MQFDFSDAEVAECRLEAGVLVLRLAAARVQDGALSAEPQWRPLSGAGTGVVTTQPSTAGAWLGRLQAGCVRQGGERWSSLALPWRSAGPVGLELEFAQGATVQLQCQTLAFAPVHGGAVVGAYQC